MSPLGGSAKRLSVVGAPLLASDDMSVVPKVNGAVFTIDQWIITNPVQGAFRCSAMMVARTTSSVVAVLTHQHAHGIDGAADHVTGAALAFRTLWYFVPLPPNSET